MELELGCIINHSAINCDLIVVYMDNYYERFIAVNTERNIVAIIDYKGEILHNYDFTDYYKRMKEKSNIKVIDKLFDINDFDNE